MKNLNVSTAVKKELESAIEELNYEVVNNTSDEQQMFNYAIAFVFIIFIIAILAL